MFRDGPDVLECRVQGDPQHAGLLFGKLAQRLGFRQLCLEPHDDGVFRSGHQSPLVNEV